MRTRDFWLQRGVIPRWEYLLVFLAILGANFYGYRTLQNQSDEVQRQADANSRQADANSRLIRQQAQLARGLKAEVRVRLDQNCVLFERNWQADIVSLGNTYKYIAQLTPEEARQSLNRAIIRSVRMQEKTEKANRPPTYCKGKVGLNDKKFLPTPKRPPELR